MIERLLQTMTESCGCSVSISPQPSHGGDGTVVDEGLLCEARGRVERLIHFSEGLCDLLCDERVRASRYCLDGSARLQCLLATRTSQLYLRKRIGAGGALASWMMRHVTRVKNSVPRWADWSRCVNIAVAAA